MGEEIQKTKFSQEDERLFSEHLQRETKTLRTWYENSEFDDDSIPTLGLEVECWLVDKSFIPNPINDDFLKAANNPMLVHELSKFNFEINTQTQKFMTGAFSTIEQELVQTWNQCIETANRFSAHPLLIGILPTVQSAMLDLKFISSSNRYRTLNERLFELRCGLPLNIDIRGREHFRTILDNLMLEAAATSVQVHIQVTPQSFKDIMNASMWISAPLVAIAANAPYLYGFRLWDDTRIPVFEQAVNCPSSSPNQKETFHRVGFGHGFINKSPLEPFLENQEIYSILLPYLNDDPMKENQLPHLRLHNGTVWRWNRPLIGFSPNGKPHFRIEQRVMSSGPTPRDIVANMAFYCGLTYALADEIPSELLATQFEKCKSNFYNCAQNGLNSTLTWFDKNYHVQELIVDELIPLAKKGLQKFKVSNEEIKRYIDETIEPRARSGQTGSRWLDKFAELNGRDFPLMCKKYWENQLSNQPVHQWSL